MKNGPSLPSWAIGLILAGFLVAIVGVGYKYVMGDGPLPESQYPKEAFQPPTYSGPARTYMKDGKPVNSGRPDPAASSGQPSGGASSSNPYGSAYGQRPN